MVMNALETDEVTISTQNARMGSTMSIMTDNIYIILFARRDAICASYHILLFSLYLLIAAKNAASRPLYVPLFTDI